MRRFDYSFLTHHKPVSINWTFFKPRKQMYISTNREHRKYGSRDIENIKKIKLENSEMELFSLENQ